MKKLYIIANWKSNKTIYQTEEWFRIINNSLASRRSGPVTFKKEEKEVIVCSPFTLLPKVKELTVNCKLSIVVGAQDISQFDEGAYTGAINGRQIKEFADYVLIGHSERRKNFNESDEMLSKKVELANKYGLTPIFCVQGVETQIPSDVIVIAYEPINAIGTGHPDTPENAQEMASFFKKNYNIQYVLYGGSVTSKNLKDFTQMSNIDGVLIGKASLDAQEFYKIIQNS